METYGDDFGILMLPEPCIVTKTSFKKQQGDTQICRPLSQCHLLTSYLLSCKFNVLFIITWSRISG
jgi:hypothetical protein